MIFKKLKLKNFMSYADAEIDFSGIHTACLTGENGAGKSSLLDAMTWTVWEEGRSRSDEIMKLGTREMSSDLEFYMEDDLYRIYRSRVKSKKGNTGKSNLEFQIFNQKESSWISLSKHTVRQTQELINKTLKMDYDTFVNSVYLRQGKADEFTTKKPKDRKQVLADIIGLSQYDDLCEKARAKAREIEKSVSVEKGVIDSLEEKLSNENDLKAELKTKRENLSKLESSYKALKQELTSKEKELNQKKEKENQIKTLEKSIENQKSLIEALSSQLKNIDLKISRNKELLDNKEEITLQHNEYSKIKVQFEALDKVKEDYTTLTNEKSDLESKLKEKLNDADRELAVFKSKVKDKDAIKKELSSKLKDESMFLNDFLPKAQTEIKRFKGLQEKLNTIEIEGQEIKHKKELLEVELGNFDGKDSEIKKKIETLDSHDHSEACPLCKGEINNKDLIIKSYKEDIKRLEQEKGSIESKIKGIETEILEKRNKYKEIKSEINAYGKAIAECLRPLEHVREEEIKMVAKSDGTKAISFLESQLEVTRKEYQKAKEQMVIIEKELEEINDQASSIKELIASGNLLKEVSSRLKDITGEIKSLNYDPEKHEKLRRSLSSMDNIPIQFSLLKKAETESSELKSEKESIEKKVLTGKKEESSLSELTKSISLEIKDIDSLSETVSGLKSNESKLNLEITNMKNNVAVLEENLNEITKIKEEVKSKKQKIEDFIENKKHFEILEKAFSKNGIQVAIIETIVPELEKEANRILTKLTENQMHIALRTQREKKTGEGIQETLDVIIADNQGTRNYELYSGGEAFKINFALRLALSRLLTNRTGAKLQTLTIDEGFGSQDASGKERLIEIIKSIQNEFELILVVTHLDELKDSFPSQIHVFKEDDGSKIRLVA